MYLWINCIHMITTNFHLQGDYDAKAIFYGRSNPDVVLGCVNIAFSVAEAGAAPAPTVRAAPAPVVYSGYAPVAPAPTVYTGYAPAAPAPVVSSAYSPYAGAASPFVYFNRG